MKARVNQISVTKRKQCWWNYFFILIRITEINSQTLAMVYYIYLLPAH
jgi:hypothetical protein